MLHIFKADSDFVSRCPMDRTSCPDVFVHPDLDMLCILFRSFALIISWDKNTGCLNEDEIVKKLQSDTNTTFIRRIK